MIDIWYIVPRRPRMEAGATSATYMGDSSETPPTASPASNRAITNALKLGAKAVSTDVQANNTEINRSSFLRPHRSDSLPAITHPNAQPNRRELNAQPSPRSLRANSLLRYGPAPVMMAMSNPKSKPPRAAVHPRNTTYPAFLD